jgi:hypothetical protein
MTKMQKQLIETIKLFGGNVMASPYGLYSIHGTSLAFPSFQKAYQQHTTRNAFLSKFCVPYTTEETKQLEKQKYRNLDRYQRLAVKCIYEQKFSTAIKILGRAEDVQDILSNKSKYIYFHLKNDL